MQFFKKQPPNNPKPSVHPHPFYLRLPRTSGATKDNICTRKPRNKSQSESTHGTLRSSPRLEDCWLGKAGDVGAGGGGGCNNACAGFQSPSQFSLSHQVTWTFRHPQKCSELSLHCQRIERDLFEISHERLDYAKCKQARHCGMTLGMAI